MPRASPHQPIGDPRFIHRLTRIGRVTYKQDNFAKSFKASCALGYITEINWKEGQNIGLSDVTARLTKLIRISDSEEESHLTKVWGYKESQMDPVTLL